MLLLVLGLNLEMLPIILVKLVMQNVVLVLDQLLVNVLHVLKEIT